MHLYRFLQKTRQNAVQAWFLFTKKDAACLEPVQQEPIECLEQKTKVIKSGTLLLRSLLFRKREGSLGLEKDPQDCNGHIIHRPRLIFRRIVDCPTRDRDRKPAKI